MANKRESLKGKGKGLFLDAVGKEKPEEADNTTGSQADTTASLKTIQSTLYMTPDLWERLTDVWSQKKRKFRTKKMTKNLLVLLALSNTLDDIEKGKFDKEIERAIGR